MKVRIACVLCIASCLAGGGPARADSFGVTLAPWNEVTSFGDPRGSGFGVVTM